MEGDEKNALRNNAYNGGWDKSFLKIFSSNNFDDAICDVDSNVEYSNANGIYYKDYDVMLSEGKYFFAEYADSYCVGDFEFSINYTPNISKSKITQIKPKKNGFKVNLKKSGTATGYQIKYSANKNMSNAKTVKTTKSVKTIKGLKNGKTYYVKVRAYRKLMVNGKMKTYYSKWSARKSVKTK